MKKIISLMLLAALNLNGAQKNFKVNVLHDPKSDTKDEMQVYFFDNFSDSIIFTQSLQKPKAERHKSILGLHYLSDTYLKKGKRQVVTLDTHQPMIYFVAVHAPGEKYTVSTGEVTSGDQLKIKVNKDGSLGYSRRFNGNEENIGWKE